jgi:hypothetical protein
MHPLPAKPASVSGHTLRWSPALAVLVVLAVLAVLAVLVVLVLVVVLVVVLDGQLEGRLPEPAACAARVFADMAHRSRL